ncbi:hypothetical protein [Nocardia sp. NPDC047654]|uniref:hypothetical protein n=1 Tax=Nocardia sp. NPDC047654 TaxID=3364314 RepID=UPI0037202F63
MAGLPASALGAFPTQSLLIHIKSNDPAEGEALADRLAAEKPDRLTVYVGDEPIAAATPNCIFPKATRHGCGAGRNDSPNAWPTRTPGSCWSPLRRVL